MTLDQIERLALDFGGDFGPPLATEDILALVGVIKAADYLVRLTENSGFRATLAGKASCESYRAARAKLEERK